MCGACPIPAGSGKTNGRHRLYRGGNRQANAALYRAVIVRMRWHQPTIDYVDRRTTEGLSKRELSAASSATSPGKLPAAATAAAPQRRPRSSVSEPSRDDRGTTAGRPQCLDAARPAPLPSRPPAGSGTAKRPAARKHTDCGAPPLSPRPRCQPRGHSVPTPSTNGPTATACNWASNAAATAAYSVAPSDLAATARTATNPSPSKTSTSPNSADSPPAPTAQALRRS